MAQECPGPRADDDGPHKPREATQHVHGPRTAEIDGGKQGGGVFHRQKALHREQIALAAHRHGVGSLRIKNHPCILLVLGMH